MSELSLVQTILVWVIPVLFAITVHEVAHGYVASLLGDHSARMLGRLTLNPVKHIDPIGTIIVPIGMLLLTSFVFGWAKPVPINATALKRPKIDMAWVALAGPGANFLMAILWTGLIIVSFWVQSKYLMYVGIAGIQINIILGVLNLLPLPPLDGSRVVGAMLPSRLMYYYDKLEPYGLIILLVLLVTGVLGSFLFPIIHYLINLLLLLAQ